MRTKVAELWNLPDNMAHATKVVYYRLALDGKGELKWSHVDKQRNGPTGVVKVGWFRRWCRFEPIEDKWEERKDTTFDNYNNNTF